ncbi:NAD(P)-dependent glycerol-3-phosphate dehydrogenase [Alphaproteobacteria bacterium]|nr:NAD(P)-dependent glycerol-3-phosphate dehydrogenase [Alphaproteobacteria bacterium]
MNEVLILGGGAWGTALANLLADNTKKTIYLWTLENEVSNTINTKFVNERYLPFKKINKKIKASSSLPSFNIPIIFIVIPSQHVYDFFKKFKKYFKKNHSYYFIICSKGIDLKRKMLLSEIIKNFFPNSVIAILSGPSFAIDVVNKKPTAVTLATRSSKIQNIAVGLLRNSYFRIYLSKDIVGVQINGAMKNVLAIAAGLTEGLNLGENARAAVLSRGIKEIVRLTKVLGGKKDTIMGLSGLGDIILTCVSKSSRNYKLGYKLGQGKSLKSILKKNDHVAEGLENIRVIYFFKKKYKIDMPILTAMYNVLVKNYTFNNVVKGLLERPFVDE